MTTPTPEEHIRAIRFWVNGDRGLRGDELRAAADFFEAMLEQRKPLADAQIKQIAAWHSTDMSGPPTAICSTELVDFARDVERAHGIGDKA